MGRWVSVWRCYEFARTPEDEHAVECSSTVAVPDAVVAAAAAAATAAGTTVLGGWAAAYDGRNRKEV